MTNHINNEATRYTTCRTPVGEMVVAGTERGVTHVRIICDAINHGIEDHWRSDTKRFRDEADQFRAYFAGDLKKFDIRFDLTGTPFQMRTWKALQRVPYGTTTTYGALAVKVGSPRGSRAVGLAMNRNPISIALPCHRVVGSNGKLTGYLNGLDLKQNLLAFERANAEGSKRVPWKSCVQSALFV